MWTSRVNQDSGQVRLLDLIWNANVSKTPGLSLDACVFFYLLQSFSCHAEATFSTWKTGKKEIVYVEFEISLTKDVSLRSIGKIKIYHACVVKKKWNTRTWRKHWINGRLTKNQTKNGKKKLGEKNLFFFVVYSIENQEKDPKYRCHLMNYDNQHIIRLFYTIIYQLVILVN